MSTLYRIVFLPAEKKRPNGRRKADDLHNYETELHGARLYIQRLTDKTLLQLCINNIQYDKDNEQATLDTSYCSCDKSPRVCLYVFSIAI